MNLLKPSRRDILKMTAAAPALTLTATRVAALSGPNGDQAPGYFKFTLGDAKLTVVSDGNLSLPASSAGVNADPAEVQAFMIRHFMDTNRILAHTNHVVIELSNAVVLVDVGSGNRFVDSAGRMLENLEAAGIDYDSITHVVLTHAHPDHVWGIRDDFDEAIFPNAQYFIGAVEHDWWLTPDRINQVPETLQQLVAGAVNSLTADYLQLNTVEDGFEVAPGITMIDTPGHTHGHMSLRIESNDEQLLVLGDAARNAYFDFERPDWVGSPDMDPDQTVATRKRLFDMAATDRIAVLGYHFPFPGVGHVMVEGDAYRYVPATWQWQ